MKKQVTLVFTYDDTLEPETSETYFMNDLKRHCGWGVYTELGVLVEDVVSVKVEKVEEEVSPAERAAWKIIQTGYELGEDGLEKGGWTHNRLTEIIEEEYKNA